jgi:L-alanine-DL-glutamate epimerase-like enolase superfamily enzyme
VGLACQADGRAGLGDEATTRRKLRAARQYPLLKLKVDAQRHVEIVRMARQEHPQARLMVDANQAWSRALLLELLPELAALGVELVAQRCRYVDLDGPLLQQLDRATPMHFHDGLIEPPSAALWG